MKKGILVIIIAAIVIIFGFIEVFQVRKMLTSLEDMVLDLDYKYQTNQSNIIVYYDELGDIKEFWEQKEEWLCFLFNHRDLSVITDSLNRLRAYTKNNDYDNATSELSLLKEYSTKSYHIMGFNIHNIL